MRALVWLRNDIRLDDNPALRNAFIEFQEVHVLYIYSPRQNLKHNESNHKINFLINSLKELAKKLETLNVNVTVINSEGFEDDPAHLKTFFNKHQFDKLFFNNTFGEDENIRDRAVKENFINNSYAYETFDDQVLYKPGYIKTNDGKPYSVFTPFKKKWLEHFSLDLLDIEFSYEARKPSKIKGNIKTFHFDLLELETSFKWIPGEKAGKNVLIDFIENKASTYNKNRNDPFIEGTSRISPYLATGTISSRRCILESLKANDLDILSGNSGILKWLDEIVWREFYRNIMHSFPKVSKGKPFQKYTDNLNWRYEESEFQAWKNGRTGFPIIDAAMRQMNQEGWMHNRLRMVVAMFFTKNMLHDWRIGEKFFMESLIDGDFSSNNGGWQWSASTGTDAAPYFRIFNPITQSKNFDKNGEFIKKYISELRDLDASVIHEPPSNIRDHLNYPQPILDLKDSRLRAIEAFKNAKDKA